jgi:hypothetical protein
MEDIVLIPTISLGGPPNYSLRTRLHDTSQYLPQKTCTTWLRLFMITIIITITILIYKQYNYTRTNSKYLKVNNCSVFFVPQHVRFVNLLADKVPARPNNQRYVPRFDHMTTFIPFIAYERRPNS